MLNKNHWNIFFIWLLPMMGLWTPAYSQNLVNDFPMAFQQLPTQGEKREFKSSLRFDGSGGHLQGIQLYKEMDHLFAFISGSSATKSYMVKVDLESPAKALAIDKLMTEPYRHAGGFQIFENYLAVGMEDNYKRTSSVIGIYNISENKNDWRQPVYTIHRAGIFERFTAGAVGITKYKEDILIVVANWNSLNIDFYFCPSADFYAGVGEFHYFGGFNPAEVSTIDWSDSAWRSYQNINLFADAKEGLYLVGFAREGEDQHLADLFQVTLSEDLESNVSNLNKKDIIQIQKIHTKAFNCQDQTDFKAGAGMNILGGQLVLVSSPYQIESKTFLNFFQSSLFPAKVNP